MKGCICILIILIGFISCKKDQNEVLAIDLTPGVSSIHIESSSTILPFNQYGKAVLKSLTQNGDNITEYTKFYYKDIPLSSNIFIPTDTGRFVIKGVYGNHSAEIVIKAQTPLNKKVLIEYFTSRTCGFCPWIGERLDSLRTSNQKIITYSIHGQDEFEIDQTGIFQDYLKVHSRPAVRINRGYVRNYAAPLEIRPLIDSINYFLSKQAEVELSIESNLTGNELSADIYCKYYKEIKEDIFLTVVLVEDGITTINQSNYFSGASYKNCPYTLKPNPIPEYSNFNILRKFISDPLGDAIVKEEFKYEFSRKIGSYQIHIDNLANLGKGYIIAILHERKDTIDISSVINSQIVKIGNDVDFNE